MRDEAGLPACVVGQIRGRACARTRTDGEGQGIQLDQRTKAESDFAVAAASILAREKFIDWLDATGKRIGTTLPRGVSQTVKDAGRKIATEGGREALAAVAKMHFKTAAEVLS